MRYVGAIVRTLLHMGVTVALLVGCGSTDHEPATTTSSTTGPGGSAGGSPVEGGADLACPPGELLVADGTCLAPGVEECASGFETDGRGGCMAILPDAPCEMGFMAVPGDETCQSVATCGASAYDGIPVEPSTVYVDPTYSGSVTDGSLAMPYTTLDEAMAAAPAGAIVALAPGTYAPAVITKSLRIWAACPDWVTFSATTGAAIRIEADAVELHRLAVTGRGVVVDGATGVLMSEMWLHDADTIGLRADGGADVTLVDSLVERATGRGAVATESAVTVDRSEIRDGIPDGGGNAYGAASSDADATLSILGSWLHHGTGIGLDVVGGQALVERTVVSDTRMKDGAEGSGVYVRTDADGERGSLELRDVIVERNNHHGVVVYGSELEGQRVIIRDVVSHDATTSSGRCMRVLARNGVFPSVLLSQSALERCQDAGILATQADVIVESTIIRDIDPHPVTNELGIGLVASSRFGVPTTLQVRGLVVERTSTAGVLVTGSTGDLDSVFAREPSAAANEGLGFGVVFAPGLEDGLSAQGAARQVVIEDAVTVGFAAVLSDVAVEHVLIRDTHASEAGFGDGLAVAGLDPNVTFLTGSASLQASHVTIEGSERAGFAVFSAAASVDHMSASCNAIHLNIESIDGADEASIEDAGSNVCGCDDETTVCKVQSSGLEPPSVF